MPCRCPGWIAAVVLLIPAVCFSQTTRAAIIEKQIRDKQEHLQPSEPGKLEALAVLVESHAHLGGPATTDHQGWYPTFGALPPRGGLAFGAGYRTRLPGGRALADASLAWSFRGYRQFQAGVNLPRLGGGALDLRVSARVRDYPRERFFGLGPDPPLGDRVSYRLRDADYDVALTGRPRPWLKAGVDAGYLVVGLRPGTDARFPSIEQRFSDLIPAGLHAQPDYLHSTVFVEASSLDTPGNPRAGGRYTVSIGRYMTMAGPEASFNQVRGEAMHLFPFVDKRRVIALRGLVSIARPDAGGEMPFYLMPSLGGSRTLRGFDELRFRDRNLLLLGAEYRWEIFAGLDMALFIDAGKVTHAIGDLDLAGLKVSPGIGFRFNTLHGIIATFDIAQSSDGRKYLLTFGPQW